jgi:uncharacterized membrane protein YtjA (UPF0391 family)
MLLSRRSLLYFSVIFAITGVIAGFLGFTGFAGALTEIARILCFLFVILSAVSLALLIFITK